MVHEDNPPVTSVRFAPNGRYVLAFSMDSCIRLWDYVSGSVKKTYQGHVNKAFSIGGCFAVVEGEAFIVASSEDGDIVIWDVNSKEVVQRIEGVHRGPCFWVDAVGDTLVSCGKDGSIKVFTHKGADVKPLRVHLNGSGESDEMKSLAPAAVVAAEGDGQETSQSPLKESESDIKKEE
jgi:COMPASS component SWD3